MTLPLPNLDDRTFQDLVDEARKLIPKFAPEWTDHNPTDPGIVLTELFAWLAEMLIYRTNQITEADYRTFLRLVDTRPRGLDANVANLELAIHQTLQELAAPYRAVTPSDYENLVRFHWPDDSESTVKLIRSLEQDLGTTDDQSIRRAIRALQVLCVPEQDLSRASPGAAPGHISVVCAMPEGLTATAEPKVIAGLSAFLDQRRLLGTKVHVMMAGEVEVTVEIIDVAFHDGVEAAKGRQRIQERVQQFFSSGAAGWPLGRDVYYSDLIGAIERLVEVNTLASVKVLRKTGDDARDQLLNVDGLAFGFRLGATELLTFREAVVTVTERQA